MNQILRLLLGLAIGFSWLSSNAQDNARPPLIGDDAPAFTAQSTKGMIDFPGDYLGKWKIILSHPADFTAVCTSEIFELAMMQEEFRKLNTQLLVLSTDGLNSHIEWVKSIKELKYKGETVDEIDFPIIADDFMDVSRKYGMLHPNSQDKRTVRAVFIIDPEDKIQTILYYPMEIGRNMEEIKRTLQALQLVDRKDCLTPANWEPGQDVLLPSPESEEAARKMEIRKNDKVYNLNWYLWFEKMN